MNKLLMKKLIAFSILFVIGGLAAHALPKKTSSLEVLPLLASESKQANRVWVGTFQLVWNDFMDGIIKGPIKFEGYESQLADALNKQKFKANQLSEDSYYKTYGEISPELKDIIEKGIKEKFDETSDILGSIDWTPAPGKYLVYAMLKKDFKFLTAFDKLKPEKFGKNRTKVNFFGINNDSDAILRNMVHVMFYNSSDDFAVYIRTQGKDEVYLYRTDDNKTFDRLYSDMFIKKAQFDGKNKFGPEDELKVPDINLYAMKTFGELTNKVIKNTDGIMISTAVETIEFKMNNEGVKLKSEAAIATTTSILLPDNDKPRKFHFNDTFVMFLQESGKNKPYFALRVQDVDMINKTGR